MLITRRTHIHKTLNDRVFLCVNYFLLCVVFVIVVYPVYFVLLASFSDSVYVNSGKIMLWPKDFHVAGYDYVFKEKRIWMGYGNTIIYGMTGTLLGVTVTMMAGYALHVQSLPGRNLIMGIMVFTMYFSGGLIPLYLVVKAVNLFNTRAAIIILGSVSVYNIILTRTFLRSTIPRDLLEAAAIDGCGYGRFFYKITIPLSKPIIAVLALYLLVGYWNSYFNALIYLQDVDKKPLSLFLREILLVNAESVTQQTSNADEMAEYQRMLAVIKYAVIVVSTAPIMCVYPFLQKYFVKGVMIGSLKG